MIRLAHNEWHSHVTKLKAALEKAPHDFRLAAEYWDAISGSLGYDVRDGKRVVDTFRPCALRSDEGLAKLVVEFRKLFDDSGELPRASLFDPPLENLLRLVAGHPNHKLSTDAAWILGFLDTD